MELSKVEYIFWPSQALTDLSDEFVVRGCRVTLRDARLTVGGVIRERRRGAAYRQRRR